MQRSLIVQEEARLSAQNNYKWMQQARTPLHSMVANLTLKPLVPEFSVTNRYKLLVDQIQRFTSDEYTILEKQEVLEFAARFFQTIDVDIQVLENNQIIREDSLRTQSRLVNLERELRFLSAQVLGSAVDVRTEPQFKQFVRFILSNYYSKISAIQKEYDSLRKVEVCTSLDMENVYDPEGADEDYYSKYQVPLIEVLQRMKRSMGTLAEEIKRSSKVELPGACINFLANSRNLILELDNFLLSKDCVFNKLLSHVISAHKLNLDKVGQIARQHYRTAADLITEVQRLHYLTAMSSDHFRAIQTTLQSCADEIKTKVSTEESSRRWQQTLSKVKSDLKGIKRYVTDSGGKYLVQFTTASTNLAIKKYFHLKEQLISLSTYLSVLGKLSEFTVSYENTVNKLKSEHQALTKQILQCRPVTLIKPVFAQIFLALEDILLRCNVLLHTVETTCKELPQSHSAYRTTKEEVITSLIEDAYKQQQILLVMYEQGRKGHQAQSNGALDNAGKVIRECEEVLALKFEASRESSLPRWDRSISELIKRQISLIMNASSMLEATINFEDQHKQEKVEALTQLKRWWSNYQALLGIYDTQIRAEMLMGIVSSINFESQNSKQVIADHNECRKDIANYSQQMKNFLSNPILEPKIHRILKQRLTVVAQLEPLINLIFQINKQVIQRVPKQFVAKQIVVGNKPILDYITLLCISQKDLKYKLLEIQQQKRLNPETTALLVDLGDKFIQTFEIYFDDYQKLNNYMSLLTAAYDYSTNADTLINELIKKVESPVDENWKKGVLRVCEDMNSLNRQVEGLSTLEKGKLGKLDYADFKDQVKKRQDFFNLARVTYDQKSVQPKPKLDVSLKDNKAKETRAKILSSWPA